MSDVDEDVVAASDDENELGTAAQALQKLEEVFTTEIMSPVLCQHESDLVDCMLDQITQMTENLKRCKKQDLRVGLHKMELERIRYMLTSYLRVRLEKIERCVHHYLEQDASARDGSENVLSPDEANYAKEYAASIEEHFQYVALQHMPESINVFDVNKVCAKPNLDSHIFLKMKEAVYGVLVDEDMEAKTQDEIDLEEGSQYLIRYRSVKDLLQSGAATFI